LNDLGIFDKITIKNWFDDLEIDIDPIERDLSKETTQYFY